MRYFFSSGEASGEFAAVVLAQAIRRIDPHAQFEGIGSTRMREAGFSLWRDHAGWATFGPFDVIPRLPKVILAGLATAAHIASTKPDVVVLVDFGAFNIRLTKILRSIGYQGRVIDVFPPGAWLDQERMARDVARIAMPLTAFKHQRDFYRSLDLPIAYFGHPLASEYALRPLRPTPPSDGGVVALLPGSRRMELRYHVPVLFGAYRQLKMTRPNLRAVIGAANATLKRELAATVAREELSGVQVVAGTRAAIENADAAWVASGTAVLECALSGVPSVALYVVSPALARYIKRAHTWRYITLPNIILEREVLPEFLQQEATPEHLAQAMDAVLADPQVQYRDLATLHDALGPPDALDQCAAFIVDVAAERAA